MKIGILTFHRAINYGAVLQCYGLYETLRAAGHEVEVIDYRPEYIERYRRAISFFDIQHQKTLSQKVKLFVASLFNCYSKLEAARRFDRFLYKHFILSKIVRKPEEMIQKYDIIFFGSDQIWSPQICYGYDPIYWGQFTHEKTKLYTYAASLGGHNHLSYDEWIKVGRYLKAFESISVREKQLQEDLRAYLKIDSELVVDPTLLVNEDVFNKMVERPKSMPDRYVLLFAVAPTENLMGFAKKVSDQLDSEVVFLTSNKTPWYYRKNESSYKIVTPSVGEFLGWFLYAKCVVTVSFHGTVFSVIFRKDFYSLTNYMQDRAEQFLHSINLEKRMVSTDKKTIENLTYTKVDYSGIEEKLEQVRKRSIEFLQNII